MSRETFYKRFGEIVRAERERQAYQQDRVATVVGISRATLGNIEAGRGSVELGTAFYIMMMLGISAKDVMGIYLETRPQPISEVRRLQQQFGEGE